MPNYNIKKNEITLNKKLLFYIQILIIKIDEARLEIASINLNNAQNSIQKLENNYKIKKYKYIEKKN